MEYVGNKAIIGTTLAGIGGTLVGSGLGYYAGKRSNSKKSRKRKSKNRSVRKRSFRSKRRKQKQPYTAGKRRDTSHRRIRYTKNNQPYIILASGKVRFISKKSVKNSRKRKGGKY